MRTSVGGSLRLPGRYHACAGCGVSCFGRRCLSCSLTSIPRPMICAKITFLPIVGGGYTIVDTADVDPEKLLEYRWRLHPKGYVIGGPDGRTRLHRYLLKPGADVQLDHVNREKLDNRRANLRLCSASQNSINRPTALGTFRGVYQSRGRYRARICTDGKRVELGSFNTREDAHRAYLVAAADQHGSFNPVIVEYRREHP